MAYFSIRFSSRPADDEHHFGHGKAENLSGFIEAGQR
jgi:divalent metal cation (Fe/Co/Zn/Cd) transporter